ncbi:hypothetical protein [Ruegeria sp. A3M17]|uniref:hypothetical protein n=1 Tax=Ruegeria sp. A3M17 TaxID=2267229 RepID=UPI000DEBA00B|nr:hypothetical protein [Ruegeria sp. A3M17]RBW52343.1 hypothetical protein DS906_21790 [Ruegeria sp. A3M17]
MKMSKRLIISITFALGFGAISSLAVGAENAPGCKAYKDATYCSTYNVTAVFSAKIATNEDTSTHVLGLLSVSNKAEQDIRFYVSFKLIQALASIEEGFTQTEDYRQFKSSVLHQMLEYVSLTGDEIRVQTYLGCLDFFVEPEVDLPRSANVPLKNLRQLSEDSKLHIKCIVESDIPFLPMEDIVEFDEFKTCMNG